MFDDTMSELHRQTVITRLATLNSAVTFLTLTHGDPPPTIEDWLTLAELVEQWVWRGLTPESLTPLSPPVPPPAAPSPPPPALAPPVHHDPTVSPPALPPLAERPNGTGPRPSLAPVRPPAVLASSPPAPPPGPRQGPRPEKATGNQIKAIFGVGKAKGYSTTDLKMWVKGQFNKGIDDLAFREASKLIEYLKAL